MQIDTWQFSWKKYQYHHEKEQASIYQKNLIPLHGIDKPKAYQENQTIYQNL